VLVLTRKKNESIIINDNIEITVVDVQGEVSALMRRKAYLFTGRRYTWKYRLKTKRLRKLRMWI